MPVIFISPYLDFSLLFICLYTALERCVLRRSNPGKISTTEIPAFRTHSWASRPKRVGSLLTVHLQVGESDSTFLTLKRACGPVAEILPPPPELSTLPERRT